MPPLHIDPLSAIWVLPAPKPSYLLFIAFAALVVHVSQRLTERAELTIHPQERRDQFRRTAIRIGTLVWALDVAGLFLYPSFSPQTIHLPRLCLALIVMVFSMLVSMPSLKMTLEPYQWGATARLTLGALLSHIVMMSAWGRWTGHLRGEALLLSILLTGLLICGITLRNRVVRIKAVRDQISPVPWLNETMAGLAILPLHICMVNVVEIVPNTVPAPGSRLSLLLIIVFFSLALSVDQIRRLRMEERHQNLLNQGLALLRSFHPPKLSKDSTEFHLAIISEKLESYLSPKAMQLHFHPICPIQRDGARVRLETLLRVSDSQLGAIHPELFFLVCEQVDKTSWADRTILETAMVQSRTWLSEAPNCEGISVNVAPSTLLAPDFVDWLREQLSRHHFPKGWVQLEITEHAIISQTQTLSAVLHQLAAIDIPVVLDDFGSGFSSLTTLADLPIHGIKCDMAFARDLSQSPTRQVLLRHICRLGHSLGLNVTVEGVETLAELKIVQKTSADHVQGYVFTRPLPQEHVLAWLQARSESHDMLGLEDCQA